MVVHCGVSFLRKEMFRHVVWQVIDDAIELGALDEYYDEEIPRFNYDHQTCFQW